MKFDVLKVIRLFFCALVPLCTTKTCVTVASSILNAMDDAIDPCDDFYQFACGGWIKAHPIPPGESRWDAFGVMRKENQVVLKNILGKINYFLDLVLFAC